MIRTNLGALWEKYILRGAYSLEDVPHYLYDEVEDRLEEIEQKEEDEVDVADD